MSNIARIESCWYLYKQNIKPKIIAKDLGVHKATVYRWIANFKRRGYKRTIKHYQNCKKGRRRKRITPQIRALIIELRRKHHNCCGEKLKHYLKRDHDLVVSVATIYRVLGKKFKLKRRYKGMKYGEAPKGEYERNVVQTDTVDFGEVYAYTYIDTYTRQAFVDLELDLESESGKASLQEAGKLFGQIDLIQSDGGPEFKGEFKKVVKRYAKKHRVSRPYKKNEQSFIESFNRTLRKECLGWKKYSFRELPKMKKMVKEWLEYYHNERAHIGLNMKTPNEVAFCRI